MNWKKYEAVFILDIRKVDDEGEAFSKEFAELIKGLGGEMHECVSLGRKQFAREISKRKAGIYWNYIFSLSTDKTDDIRKKYKLDERVLRELVINYERPELVIT